MKKTLYFEGAGMDYTNLHSDIGNYRIRTAFTNNEGKQIYLEISGHEFTEGKGKKKTKIWKTSFDHVHYITGDNDDCNKNSIKVDWQVIRSNCKYTKEDLIKYINQICNTSFEDMEVLNEFEGYRVHGDYNKYNFMEDHKINRARTAAREAAYNKIDKEYREKLGSEYSKISYMNFTDTSIFIRCYASDEAIKAAGITERIKEIEVTY